MPAIAALVSVVGALGLVLLGRRLVSPAEPDRVEPFLSGFPAAEHALSRYHVRWYAMSLLFLAFDVEMLFMYPWAVVLSDVGMSGLVEMFGFLAVLMVGVAYAWREGALRWA